MYVAFGQRAALINKHTASNEGMELQNHYQPQNNSRSLLPSPKLEACNVGHSVEKTETPVSCKVVGWVEEGTEEGGEEVWSCLEQPLKMGH